MKHKKRGSIGVGFVAFFVIFLMLSGLIIEIYNAYNCKSYVNEEMYRSCNIAMDIAMKDSARMTHIGEITETKAEEEFYKYLDEVLGYTALDASKTKWGKADDDGNWKYIIELSDLDIVSKPPSVSVSGYLKTQPVILQQFLDEWNAGNSHTINIPFSTQSRNAENIL